MCSDPECLGTAWAEAEAALPEGWFFRVTSDGDTDAFGPGDAQIRVDGHNAAALRALVAELRGVGR
jgi:hypothetical protein